jgi:hypothetical protein
MGSSGITTNKTHGAHNVVDIRNEIGTNLPL